MEKELLIEASFYAKKAVECMKTRDWSMFNYAEGVVLGLVKAARILRVNEKAQVELGGIHSYILALRDGE